MKKDYGSKAIKWNVHGPIAECPIKKIETDSSLVRLLPLHRSNWESTADCISVAKDGASMRMWVCEHI